MFKKTIAIVCAFTLAISCLSVVNIDAKKIRLNKTRVIVRVGSRVKLKVKNTKKTVKWKTSNKKIATVSKKGVVKGKSDGNCKITAKVGKKKIKCEVAVANKVAKKISKKTFEKLATLIKTKGSYNPEGEFYCINKRLVYAGYAYMARLKFYVKKNYIEVGCVDNNDYYYFEFRAGDKENCIVVYEENNYYMQQAKGLCNKKRVKYEEESITITYPDVPDNMVAQVKQYLYRAINNTTWEFDLIILV